MRQALCATFGQYDIPLTSDQADQLVAYNDLLLDWNQRINLTALTATQDVCEKHFLDSAFFGQALAPQGPFHLIDIGTGAGFPGMVMKILYPEMTLTLLDGLQKRLDFLQHVATELGLAAVTTVHGRAEDLAKAAPHREAYDVAVARAVARLPMLLELCSGFVRIGGQFVAMKGPEAGQELDDAAAALATLGLHHSRSAQFTYGTERNGREILFFTKDAPTPTRYPRRYKAMQNKPL